MLNHPVNPVNPVKQIIFILDKIYRIYMIKIHVHMVGPISGIELGMTEIDRRGIQWRRPKVAA